MLISKTRNFILQPYYYPTGFLSLQSMIILSTGLTLSKDSEPVVKVYLLPCPNSSRLSSLLGISDNVGPNLFLL